MKRSSVRVQRSSAGVHRSSVGIALASCYGRPEYEYRIGIPWRFFPLSNKQWRNRERMNVLYENDYKCMELKHKKINKKNGSSHKTFDNDV